MRAADARSAQIDRPAGVTRVIQVRLNKVEPSESVNGRNLLAKANDRSSCFDEPKELWPKMPRVVERFAFAGRAEWLAGARSSPDFPVVGPSGQSQCVTPDPDSGEEMALGIPSQVVWSNIGNGSLIHVPRRDHACRYKFTQPRGLLGVELVIVGGHLRESIPLLTTYGQEPYTDFVQKIKCSFRLSEEAKRLLRGLAKSMGLTQTGVIELAVRKMKEK